MTSGRLAAVIAVLACAWPGLDPAVLEAAGDRRARGDCGGIAFSSTRRRGYARCFGGQFSRRWHVYTMHRMDSDGGHLQTLSFHDTNEWFPTVLPTGRLLYSNTKNVQPS